MIVRIERGADYFFVRRCPSGQTRGACLVDEWFDDRIQSDEEWRAD